MGQKTVKRTRKIAEKTAKSMALELAKAQIIDMANQPWKIRWAFCKALLFPKRLKVSKEDKDKFKKQSFGIDIPEQVINQGVSG